MFIAKLRKCTPMSQHVRNSQMLVLHNIAQLQYSSVLINTLYLIVRFHTYASIVTYNGWPQYEERQKIENLAFEQVYVFSHAGLYTNQ